jgi:hypothetical protein
MTLGYETSVSVSMHVLRRPVEIALLCRAHRGSMRREEPSRGANDAACVALISFSMETPRSHFRICQELLLLLRCSVPRCTAPTV